MIDIDFDVYKELTARRPNEATTYNDVLRDLLKLPKLAPTAPNVAPSKTLKALVRKDVAFPSGTPLMAVHKGAEYRAKIQDGQIVVEGHEKKPTISFSRAASHVTGNNVNGWTFWKCKRPQDNEWVAINSLRKDK